MSELPLHVGFDASLLATPTPSGVEQTIRRTLDLLIEHAGGVRFIAYAPPSPPGRLARILWQQAVLPRRLKRDGADILHAPGYVAPLRAPCPTVVTVYDTLALTHPGLSKLANTLHYGLVMPRAARRAARIIVPSEHVRRQVVECLGVAEERIRLIPLPMRDFTGADLSAAGLLRVKERYALPERFILYVGNIEPKKNVETLVRAYAELRRGGRVDHKLVLAGHWAWKSRAARVAIREERIGGEIVETGYVRDEDLPALYRLASLFVFPSVEEGYGLPPLEAMAMGTPVVASNAASLPEALGRGALMVPPSDTRQLRVAIEKVLGNAYLRLKLTELGRDRVAAIDPADIVRSILETYREAASEKTH